jgi:hypothetical protein
MKILLFLSPYLWVMVLVLVILAILPEKKK